MSARDPEVVLSTTNQRLADLLRRDALALATGGAQALKDALWIWGVLGGKDVGKSSLINALAGANVVDSTPTVGEGTFQPAVYLAEADLGAARERFARLEGMIITYRSDAPGTMQGLALVDLPDFDSLFSDHLEQVRGVSRLLDGIIWVTTPKKVGDAKAIQEIQGVLKARLNFVYVVNKVDWLLSQSDQPPTTELERMRVALHEQIAATDAVNGDQRAFLISAKYRGAEGILEAVRRSRRSDVQGDAALAKQLHDAAGRVAHDFDILRGTLTTPPSAAEANANKRANLDYQLRRQARRMLEHYQPGEVARRVERSAGKDEIQHIVTRSFPAIYCDRLLGRLLNEKALLFEWTRALFRKRLSYWPLLGIIASPLTVIAAALDGLRVLIPGSTAQNHDDPFRIDGVALQERTGAVVGAVAGGLDQAESSLNIELPNGDQLARRFRQEVHAEIEQLNSAGIAPELRKKPGLIGRFLRFVIPVGVLLWFPFVQPLLDALLTGMTEGLGLNVRTLLLVVQTLSATTVLAGLGVSLLIFAALSAAIYAGAVRDAHTALDRLQENSPELASETLLEDMVQSMHGPIERFRSQLTELERSLQPFVEA